MGRQASNSTFPGVTTMTFSTRAHFERELSHLHEAVLELGSRAHRAVANGLAALLNEDADLAREVIAEDVGINRLRYDIEFECYTLLVTEQPVASDMRAIVAALTISNDLERIADHGKKIAGIYLRVLESPRPMPMGEVPALGEFVLGMIDRALHAFAARDAAEAEAVCRADDLAEVGSGVLGGVELLPVPRGDEEMPPIRCQREPMPEVATAVHGGVLTPDAVSYTHLTLPTSDLV